jgi:transposase
VTARLTRGPRPGVPGRVSPDAAIADPHLSTTPQQSARSPARRHPHEAWLRQNPGVEVVCRDRSGAYAEAVRRALPDAIQVADRWHLWHGLGETARKEVAAHSACWARAGRMQDGPRAATTRERWQQIHTLLGQNVGLLECARQLNISLNTVKRYARAGEPERLQRPPQYRPTLVDPFRDHLRNRREQEPAIGNLQLFREIKALGYAGSMNLLVRYVTRGRVEGDRPPISPRRLTSLMLTHPDHLTDTQRERRHELTTACPDMIDLTELIGSFAALLRPAEAKAHASTRGSPPSGRPTYHTCTPSPAALNSTVMPSTQQ